MWPLNNAGREGFGSSFRTGVRSRGDPDRAPTRRVRIRGCDGAVPAAGREQQRQGQGRAEDASASHDPPPGMGEEPRTGFSPVPTWTHAERGGEGSRRERASPKRADDDLDATYSGAGGQGSGVRSPGRLSSKLLAGPAGRDVPARRGSDRDAARSRGSVATGRRR
jgi:hypothetical protein